MAYRTNLSTRPERVPLGDFDASNSRSTATQSTRFADSPYGDFQAKAAVARINAEDLVKKEKYGKAWDLLMPIIKQFEELKFPQEQIQLPDILEAVEIGFKAAKKHAEILVQEGRFLDAGTFYENARERDDAIRCYETAGREDLAAPLRPKPIDFASDFSVG